MLEVKTFRDREGKKVIIGDTIGYFGLHENEPRFTGKVRRITKEGYFISVYVEGRNNFLTTTWIKKVPPITEDKADE